MGRRDRHLDQARADRAHAEYLYQHHGHDPTAMRWAVTAAFYCAVHCMQAYLLGHGANPRNHFQRDSDLANPRYGVPGDVYDAYVKLKYRSEGARYQLRTFPSTRVREEILDTLLAKITTFVGL